MNQAVGDHVNRMRQSALKGAFAALKEAFVSYASENYLRASELFGLAEEKATTAFFLVGTVYQCRQMV